ncbi:MAG: hypothetical protein M1837_002462 [Sclerophora amabilis]|nr:MAG: hypothetical protein M1837_002462 [Sclerophora amabilis]
MVLRKPVPSPASYLTDQSVVERSDQADRLPYPLTPVSPNDSNAHGGPINSQEDQDKASDTDDSPADTEWDSNSEDGRQDNALIPPSLQVGDKSQTDVAEVRVGDKSPLSLRPGEIPAPPEPPHVSDPGTDTISDLPAQSLPYQPKLSNNPYLRSQKPSNNVYPSESTIATPNDVEAGLATSQTAFQAFGHGTPAMSGALQSPLQATTSSASHLPPTGNQFSQVPSSYFDSQDTRNEVSDNLRPQGLSTVSDHENAASRPATTAPPAFNHQPVSAMSNTVPPTDAFTSGLDGPGWPGKAQFGQRTSEGHKSHGETKRQTYEKDVATALERSREEETERKGEDDWYQGKLTQLAEGQSTGIIDADSRAPTPIFVPEFTSGVRGSENNAEALPLQTHQAHEQENVRATDVGRSQASITTNVASRTNGQGDFSQTVIPDQRADEQEGPPPPKPPRPVGSVDPHPYSQSSIPDQRADEQESHPPPKPPRPDRTGDPQARTHGHLSQTTILKQASETYQIKHINWVDGSTEGSIRRSPILVQNANGPCPLLALVNALTLSTPQSETTALVETLRVREQVSLGLLLDAVFDELMSGRRGDAAQELPDVSELYQFLITLHTGMNVNPSFLTPASTPPNLMDAPEGSLSTHAAPLQISPIGSFEQTREMRLYSTFSVPLIHGWLPPMDHPAYAALDRSGKTYEDAQNLLFREEEVEGKLHREGLQPDEQQLLQDIATIKYFLAQAATQLTPNGLNAIVDTMKPGSIAILFRNDHFSTLYKHPRTHTLMQLVTDAGYAGHDEVVWESLVDVNGERCEFYAGDFRLVGNAGAETQPRTRTEGGGTAHDVEGWTTVGSSRGRHRGGDEGGVQQGGRQGTFDDTRERLNTSVSTAVDTNHTAGMGSPHAEQEDHDLALALQLQEEEEDRHRRDVAAREREETLSEQFLSQQRPQQQQQRRDRAYNDTRNRQSDHDQRPQGQTIRPLIPTRHNQENPTLANPEAGIDAPPPSYEQAASADPYHPPPSHPAHPFSAPNNSTTSPSARRRARGSSGYTQPRPGAAYAQPQPQHLQAGPSPISGTRAVSMRDQARGLLNEFQGSPSAGGPISAQWQRRRQNPGPGLTAPPATSSPAVVGHGPEDRGKDCVVM